MHSLRSSAMRGKYGSYFRKHPALGYQPLNQKLLRNIGQKKENFAYPRQCGRLRLKCDGTRAETRVRLSAKRTNQFKLAWASIQSATGSRVVRISGSNAGYNMFQSSVKSTVYTLHSPVSPSTPLPCVTVCHHVSTGICFPYVLKLTNRCT
jgi:hypothetical protein